MTAINEVFYHPDAILDFYIKLQQDKPKSSPQKKNINLIPYVILILSYKNINNTYFPFVSF